MQPTGPRNNRPRGVRRAGVACAAALVLAACGGSGTGASDAASTAVAAPVDEAPAGTTPVGAAQAGGSPELSTTPIPFRDLFDFRASAGANATGSATENTTVENSAAADGAEYTIEPCGFVTIDQLAALTGFDPASITADHNLGKFECRWEAGDQLGLSFTFGAAQGNYSDIAVAFADDDRFDELGILAVGPAVFYEVWLQKGDPRGFAVNADSEGWYGAADAIAINLVQRIEQPKPS